MRIAELLPGMNADGRESVGKPRATLRVEGWRNDPAPGGAGRDRLGQPSMSRTSPARGPLAESSSVNSTR
jgi:hypothetical protein